MIVEAPADKLCIECSFSLNGSDASCYTCAQPIHTRVQCKKADACYITAIDKYQCSSCTPKHQSDQKDGNDADATSISGEKPSADVEEQESGDQTESKDEIAGDEGVVQRPSLFSQDGAKQLESDAVARRATDIAAYELIMADMRAFAIQEIERNGEECMKFLDGDVAAMEMMAKVVGQDTVQQSLLASTLLGVVQGEWGTDLTLIMLAGATTTQVHIYIQDPANQQLNLHPSYATVGPDSAKFSIILVHNSTQTHWCCAFTEAKANQLRLGGVQALTSTGERLVLMGQPGDGQCQFSSFHFALSQTAFDMKRITNVSTTFTSNNNVTPAPALHQPFSSLATKALDKTPLVNPSSSKMPPPPPKLPPSVALQLKPVVMATDDNFQLLASKVRWGGAHLASKAEREAIPAW